MSDDQKHTLQSVLQAIGEELTRIVQAHDEVEINFRIVTTRAGTIKGFKSRTERDHRDMLRGDTKNSDSCSSIS